MKYMVIKKAGKDCEAGQLPGKDVLEKMGQYNKELAEAGVLLALEGLEPSAKGARVKFAGKTRVVTDGPFTESKELVGGFWMFNCDSLEEAIGWAKRAPFEDGEVEVRQVHDAEVFGEAFSPELREQLSRQREKLEV
jgi:hypothetical protein